MPSWPRCRREGYSLRTRPVTPADEPFLFELYASTRRDELAAWGWDAAQQEAFLRLQYLAQSRGYAAEFPDADHRIICEGDQPVGRILVHRTEQAIALVDMALLPDFRGAGIGTALIGALQAEAEASGRPLRLQVLRSNAAARRLYERLGFRITGEAGLHLAMEWRPLARRT